MTRLSCHRFCADEVRLWLSVIAYNLGNLWRRLALPARIDSLVADQLAAAVGKNRRAFNQACTLPLAAAGGESYGAAALREHAAKDRDDAVASRIGRVQSEADCDGDIVAEGNVSAESSEKMVSPAVADHRTRNRPLPAPPETLWTKPAKTLPREAVWVYKASWNRRAKRKSRINCLRCSCNH
jgi:hypothetical protein